MRIGLECSHLTRPLAGIGFYLTHLIRELAKLDGDEEYVLFYNRELVPLELPGRLQHDWCGPRSTHLWAQTRLASRCRRQHIDLLHSPGQALPLWYRGKNILTIHDLSPLIFPQQKDWAARLVWNHLVPRMARRADHLITVSDHTRRDVMERLGIPKEKITLVYEAAAPEYYPETDPEQLRAFRREKNLEDGYLLAVSTLEPRKNYPFLLRVFAHWLERTHADARLVIIGKKGWLYEEIFETVKQLRLEERVRFEGYIADLNLLRLYYNAADFFIMSPLYEGFWLPGLEALACGTPVIAPKHSSITEVIGEAGLLLETWNEEEWIVAMNRLWQATDRPAWSQKGVERAKAFSWERAAVETLAVYRKVGEKE